MKHLFLIIIWCQAFSALAQIDPLQAPYLFNPVNLNPAYAGMNNRLELTSGYRQQWAGLDGSPMTFHFNGHMSLPNGKTGAGLLVMSDKLGSGRQNLVQAMFSYKLELDNNLQVAFGMQAGVVQFSTDYSLLNPYNTSDPVFIPNDRVTKPTLGAGMLVRNDKLYFSISAPRLLRAPAQTGDFQVNLYTQHYYINGSYLFIVNDQVSFKPGILIRMVKGAPASMDLNAMFQFKERYSAGLFTRNFRNAGIMTRFVSNSSWWASYVFEVPVSKTVSSQFLTHEITVGIRLKALNSHDNLSVIEF